MSKEKTIAGCVKVMGKGFCEKHHLQNTADLNGNEWCSKCLLEQYAADNTPAPPVSEEE